jgi:UbiD family decarboxylase
MIMKKIIFVVDDDIDIYNKDEVEWAMATRFQGSRMVSLPEESKQSGALAKTCTCRWSTTSWHGSGTGPTRWCGA